jgi:2-keto-4-pentenoate hydratase/2-oxohepta-3-ene-1,7-dioic acid hydratase in catechol pathway
LKIVRYTHRGREGVGVVSDGAVLPAGNELSAPIPVGDPIPLGAVGLLPPVPRSAKIICVGRNYADHAAEDGESVPASPLIFAKLPNSLAGPGDRIVIPQISDRVDFEAELGVVIGVRARRVPVTAARAHILGYTCVNDVSARDLQMSDQQWTRGKSLDTFCPVGPWIVTTDEIPDPQALNLRCLLNGEVMQHASTAEMVFDVDSLVSFISQGITLEPGDLIATGTPAGSASGSRRGTWSPGDIVRVEIERIGYLENPVAGDPRAAAARSRPRLTRRGPIDERSTPLRTPRA